MSQELKAITRELKATEYRCDRCGKVFTSLMRLQHHRAAEHAPRTVHDIRTTKDIPHSTRSRP